MVDPEERSDREWVVCMAVAGTIALVLGGMLIWVVLG
jgi:hypothetical protein